MITHQKTTGFTLIEILVVVIIIGICATIVIPAIGSHNDQNAAAAARSLAADVIYTQNRAILSQSFRYLKYDAVNQSYAILISKPNATPLVYETNPSTLQNYVALFGNGAPPGGMQTVFLQTASADGKTCLAFDEVGQPYACDAATGVCTLLAATATFPVRSGTITLTVKVDPFTGAVSVQ